MSEDVLIVVGSLVAGALIGAVAYLSNEAEEWLEEEEE